MKQNTNRMIAVLAMVMVMTVPFAMFLSTDTDAEEPATEPQIELTNEMFEALSLDIFHEIKVTFGQAYKEFGQWLLGEGNDKKDTSDQDDVNIQLRNAFAYTVQSNYTTAVEIFSRLVSNQALSMAFMRAYYALQAETTASGIWSETIDYNGDRILLGSHFIEDMTVLKFNITSVLLQFSQKWDDKFLETVNEMAGTYGPMEMGWTWGPNSLYARGTSFALLDYVTPTTNSNRVYITIVGDDQTATLSGRNDLYVFGSGNATIQNMTTGQKYTMSTGVNDLESRGIPSGWYALEDGFTYAGNFMPSSEINGLSPNAALILINGSDSLLAVKSGGAYNLVHNGTTYVTSDLTMSIKYDDKDRVQNIAKILDSYQEVWDAINRAARSTVDAGLAAWFIFDALGESSTLISPYSVLASMQDNTATSPELHAAYYSLALQILRDKGASISPNDFTVSRESSDLFMYGNIYYGGTLMYEGVIFTPFVPDDVTLSVGLIRPWETTGSLMIYATGLSSIEEWTGVGVTPRILEMDRGFSTQIYNIVYDGVEVSTIDLTHERMTYLGLMDLNYLIDPPEIHVESKAKYVQIIMILIGAILVLVGFLVPGPSNKIIVWIIAAVIILLGWFAAGWFTGFF